MTIKILSSDIYILDMNKPVYIKDLAHKLIKAYGLKPNTDIDVKYTTLREGERIAEELVPKQAVAISEGIYKIEHEKMNGRAFYRKLNLLNIATKENDKDNIRKIIADILPEFEYKVSKSGTHKNKYLTIANTDEFVG